MTANARAATPGLWADSSTRLTRTSASALKSAGYVGVFRYVPLPGVNAAADIDADELAMLLDVGLEVGLVQHVRFKETWLDGWSPRAHSGASDAAVAADAAQHAGYGAGHIFCDFEDVDTTCTAEGARVFLEAWASRALQSGFRAGVYVGFQIPLTPEQLYELRGVDIFWSDAGHRKVATRGVAISQGPELTVGGVRIDTDQVSPDLLGGLPWVAAPSPFTGAIAVLPDPLGPEVPPDDAA